MTLTATKPPGFTMGSVAIQDSGWLNSLSAKKLRSVAGPHVFQPMPHGMEGPCLGLRPGDPP